MAGLGWDGLGCDGMGWEWLGWAGMGWMGPRALRFGSYGSVCDVVTAPRCPSGRRSSAIGLRLRLLCRLLQGKGKDVRSRGFAFLPERYAASASVWAWTDLGVWSSVLRGWGFRTDIKGLG